LLNFALTTANAPTFAAPLNSVEKLKKMIAERTYTVPERIQERRRFH